MRSSALDFVETRCVNTHDLIMKSLFVTGEVTQKKYKHKSVIVSSESKSYL